jgi:hypothetical protein
VHVLDVAAELLAQLDQDELVVETMLQLQPGRGAAGQLDGGVAAAGDLEGAPEEALGPEGLLVHGLEHALVDLVEERRHRVDHRGAHHLQTLDDLVAVRHDGQGRARGHEEVELVHLPSRGRRRRRGRGFFH